MTGANGAVPPHPALFLALPAGRVPTPAMVRAVAGGALLRDVAAITAAGAWQTAAALVASFGVPRIEAMPRPAACGGALHPADRAPADLATHDRFFRIHRVGGPPVAVFLHSVLRAAALFHAEMEAEPHGRRAYFGAVGGGFAALLAWLQSVPTETLALEAEPMPLGVSNCDPMTRWIIGHQIFAALTQGLIMALQGFETAIVIGDSTSVRAALGLAANLLAASAMAFRFACDFPSEAYRDVVRPSMMPPHIREGFSGLLSDDHRALVKVLTRLRPLMAAAEIQFPAAHARLTRALQRVYDDHVLICARFGGAAAPSLRGQTCSHLSGVVQLEQYRHARLRLLRPPVQAAAADAADEASVLGPIS